MGSLRSAVLATSHESCEYTAIVTETIAQLLQSLKLAKHRLLVAREPYVTLLATFNPLADM